MTTRLDERYVVTRTIAASPATTEYTGMKPTTSTIEALHSTPPTAFHTHAVKILATSRPR